jgi:hypothetical protein
MKRRDVTAELVEKLQVFTKDPCEHMLIAWVAAAVMARAVQVHAPR